MVTLTLLALLALALAARTSAKAETVLAEEIATLAASIRLRVVTSNGYTLRFSTR